MKPLNAKHILQRVMFSNRPKQDFFAFLIEPKYVLISVTNVFISKVTS